jgi:transcriptional regulator with XRE-family HTH domain
MSLKGGIRMFQGDRMRDLRKKRGFTQSQLAKMIGGNQGQVKDYEQGKRGLNTETLTKIARALNCSADYLLGLSDSPAGQMSILSSNLILLLNTLPQHELDRIERLINAMLPPDSGKNNS